MSYRTKQRNRLKENKNKNKNGREGTKERKMKEGYYFAYMYVLPACMAVHSMHTVPPGARRGLKGRGIELATVVSCHVGACDGMQFL